MCLSTFLPQKDRDPDLILAQCAQGKMWLKAADYLVFIKHLHQISSKSNKNLFEPIERRHQKALKIFWKKMCLSPASAHHVLLPIIISIISVPVIIISIFLFVRCYLNHGAIWVRVLFELRWWIYHYGQFKILTTVMSHVALPSPKICGHWPVFKGVQRFMDSNY